MIWAEHFFHLKTKKMKTVKISLENIQGKMTRAEMKTIMAGSADACKTYTCHHCQGACKCGDSSDGPCVDN
jgi:hypothetical protein